MFVYTNVQFSKRVHDSLSCNTRVYMRISNVRYCDKYVSVFLSVDLYVRISQKLLMAEQY